MKITLRKISLSFASWLFIAGLSTHVGFASASDKEEIIETNPVSKSASVALEPTYLHGDKTGSSFSLEKEEEFSPKTSNVSSNSSISDKYSGPQWGLSQEEINYVFNHSADFVCLVEFGGHFKKLNKTWENKLGWKIEELLDTPYINFVHPEDIEKTFLWEPLFSSS